MDTYPHHYLLSEHRYPTKGESYSDARAKRFSTDLVVCAEEVIRIFARESRVGTEGYAVAGTMIHQCEVRLVFRGTLCVARRERAATGTSGCIDEGEASEGRDGQDRKADEHDFETKGKNGIEGEKDDQRQIMSALPKYQSPKAKIRDRCPRGSSP